MLKLSQKSSSLARSICRSRASQEVDQQSDITQRINYLGDNVEPNAGPLVWDAKPSAKPSHVGAFSGRPLVPRKNVTFSGLPTCIYFRKELS